MDCHKSDQLQKLLDGDDDVSNNSHGDMDEVSGGVMVEPPEESFGSNLEGSTFSNTTPDETAIAKCFCTPDNLLTVQTVSDDLTKCTFLKNWAGASASATTTSSDAKSDVRVLAAGSVAFMTAMFYVL
ncbi:UNVERIFIED_CONTAM: hypothetical protein HDU68_007018 [Siphonaria sp. JEL0065]|nr:hypothetical protein HDU68_007018 [Siphonaria sp. JEL0065]